MAAKLLLVIVVYVLLFAISAITMIWGWGVQPVSWGWICFGYTATFLLSLVAPLIRRD